MATFKSIASTKLVSSSASITFSSIPQTYDDLAIYAYVKTTETGINDFGTLMVEVNGVAGTAYNTRYVYKQNTNATTGYDSPTDGAFKVPNIFTSAVSANLYSPVTMYIGGYTKTTVRVIQWKSGAAKNSTSVYVTRGVGKFTTSTAITSIRIYPVTGSMQTNTEVTIYGIKNS